MLSEEASQSIVGHEDLPPSQLLFNIGIADIDQLSSTANYIACTTDSILADKQTLFDIIVKLPHETNTSTWPLLFDSANKEIKATERDATRYHALSQHLELRPASSTSANAVNRERYTDEVDDEDAPLVPQRTNTSVRIDGNAVLQEVLESRTWTGTAYRTLAQWSHPDAVESAETAFDADLGLLQDFSAAARTRPADVRDLITILRFCEHHNSRILEGLAELSRSAGQNDEDDDAQGSIIISPLDVQDLGLDMYSVSDRAFVEQALPLLRKREGQVVDDGVRLCGVRIC